jgi:hypothetical protein
MGNDEFILTVHALCPKCHTRARLTVEIKGINTYVACDACHGWFYPAPDWCVTPPQAAEMLQDRLPISSRTMQHWCVTGVVKAIRPGGHHWLVPVSEVVRMIQSVGALLRK